MPPPPAARCCCAAAAAEGGERLRLPPRLSLACRATGHAAPRCATLRPALIPPSSRPHPALIPPSSRPHPALIPRSPAGPRWSLRCARGTTPSWCSCWWIPWPAAASAWPCRPAWLCGGLATRLLVLGCRVWWTLWPAAASAWPGRGAARCLPRLERGRQGVLPGLGLDPSRPSNPLPRSAAWSLPAGRAWMRRPPPTEPPRWRWPSSATEPTRCARRGVGMEGAGAAWAAWHRGRRLAAHRRRFLGGP